MPRVPTYQNQQRTAPLPGAPAQQPPSPAALGGNLGQGMEQLGQAFAEERLLADQALVSEKVNELHAFEQQRVYDAEQGVLAMRGKDAMAGADQLYEDFEASVEQVRGDLSDNQRRLFDRDADRMRVRMGRLVENHTRRESERFIAEQAEARIRNNEQAAAAGYLDIGDDGRETWAQADIDDHIREAQQQVALASPGVSGEVLAERQAEVESRTHAAVVGSMIGDARHKMALEYFQRHQEKLTPSHREQVGRMVGSAADELRAGAVGQLDKTLAPILLDPDGYFDEFAFQKAMGDFEQATVEMVDPPSSEDVLNVLEPYMEAASNDARSGITKLSAIKKVMPQTPQAVNALDKAERQLQRTLAAADQAAEQSNVLMRAMAGERVNQRLPNNPAAWKEFYGKARQQYDLPELMSFMAERDAPLPDAALSELNGAFNAAGGFDWSRGVAALRAIGEVDPGRLDAVITGMSDTRLNERAEPSLVRAALAGTEGMEPGTAQFEGALSVLESDVGAASVEAAALYLPGGDEAIDLHDALGVDRLSGGMEARWRDRFRYELARAVVGQDSRPAEVYEVAAERAAKHVMGNLTRINDRRAHVEKDRISDLDQETLDALDAAMGAAESQTDPGVFSFAGEARPDLMVRSDDMISVPVTKDGAVLGILGFNKDARDWMLIRPDDDDFDAMLDRILDGGVSSIADVDPLAWRESYGDKAPEQVSDRLWEQIDALAMERFTEQTGGELDSSDPEQVELYQTLFEQVATEKGWPRAVAPDEQEE